MRFSPKAKKSSKIREIVMNPVLCAVHFLKCSVWLRQQEILESVNTHRKTAVKACHASGKTFIAAIAPATTNALATARNVSGSVAFVSNR